MAVRSSIPTIANVIPKNWETVLRFNRDVQKYLNSLAKSDRTVYYTDLYLTSTTASRLLATDSAQKVVSTALANWISGTTNQIIVVDDGDGTVTLSTPQDIHTDASPTFANLYIKRGGKIYLDA